MSNEQFKTVEAIERAKTESPLSGTNFWVNFVLLFGSLFGMTQSTASMAVTAVFGILGAAFAVRTFVVSAKFEGAKKWLKDPNTWSYLGAVVVALLPQAESLLPGLQDLSNALIEGNWSKILTAGLSFLTMVYYLFFKK